MEEPTPSSVEAEKISGLSPVVSADSMFFGDEGLRAGWGILLFVAFFLALGLTTSFLASQGRHLLGHPERQGQTTAPSSGSSSPKTTAQDLYASEGLSLFTVLLTTLVLSRIERRPFTTYGLAGPSRLAQLGQGLIWGLSCLSLLAATLRLTGHLSIDSGHLCSPQAFRQGMIWAVGFALVAFLEETLLRGYLQYTLTRGLRAIIPSLSETPNTHACAFWAAALILSVIFGLGHGSNPGESTVGLLSAGLAGLVFSLALYRSGSLWWAIGFHTSWDWAQSFLYGTADSGAMIEHPFITTHPTGPAILSGGPTGPEGSIFILPILALAAVIIVVTLPKLPQRT